MNKYPCEMIGDLIPLYIEDDVSKITKDIIENHLQQCEDCSLLVLEQSSKQIDIGEIKEQLPQARTFKKFMKRLKIWIAAIGILALFVAIGMGVLGYKVGESSKDNVLTLKTVVRIFNSEGIPLKINRTGLTDDYTLEDVKPAIYNLGDNDDILLIYTFNSFGEKKEILGKTGRFSNPFPFEEFPFHAKNMLLVLKPSKSIETQDEMERLGDNLKLIRQVVFTNLNEGQERIYKGQSESWEGTLTLKYYEHWFNDDGILRHDSYYEAKPIIRYKKTDPENVNPISFEYTITNSIRRGNGDFVNKDGYFDAGTDISNGRIPGEDEEIPFKIKWGIKEEELLLKAEERQ